MKLRNSRSDAIFVGGVILVGFIFLVGKRAPQRVAASPINTYGGNLPKHVKRVFEEMYDDLGNMKGIITAYPDRICFLDKNKQRREYHFAYETLWRNGFPVITGIQAFHFEYRGEAGNLLIRVDQHLPSIETITNYVRVSRKGKQIVSRMNIKIPFTLTYPLVGNNEDVAWVAPMK